jgi:hypothetical protein
MSLIFGNNLPEVAMVFTARCLLDFPELAQGLLDLKIPRHLNMAADVLMDLTATTGNKARYYYDLLEKLADKHRHQEIYIKQAKALVNLVGNYAGKSSKQRAVKTMATSGKSCQIQLSQSLPLRV